MKNAETLVIPEACSVIKYPFTPLAKALDNKLEDLGCSLVKREYNGIYGDPILIREYEDSAKKYKIAWQILAAETEDKDIIKQFKPSEINWKGDKCYFDPKVLRTKLVNVAWGFECIMVDDLKDEGRYFNINDFKDDMLLQGQPNNNLRNKLENVLKQNNIAYQANDDNPLVTFKHNQISIVNFITQFLEMK